MKRLFSMELISLFSWFKHTYDIPKNKRTSKEKKNTHTHAYSHPN